jgi:hypothetical protein
MEDNPPLMPEHMDRWTRNQRLYETLKGMGLFVEAVPEPDDNTKIRHLIVSSDLLLTQQPAENTAERGVVRVVQRTEIADVIGTAERGRGNVIDFPSVR